MEERGGGGGEHENDAVVVVVTVIVFEAAGKGLLLRSVVSHLACIMRDGERQQL